MLLQLHRYPRAACAALAITLGLSSAFAGEIFSAERTALADRWHFAELAAASQPNCEVMIGSGNSMLPLYPDRTVLVVQRRPMSELHAGMTVVFLGDSGFPVAHVLVEKTASGWTARGLNNAMPDRTRVRQRNYLGTVVRAFLPGVSAANAIADLGSTASASALGGE